MGQSPAETVREIEETRSRLESNLRELEERLPAPAVWAKRVAGLAVGGGVGGTLFWAAIRRVRKRRKKQREAEAARPVVQVIPPEWADRLSGAMREGEWKGWLLIAGGLWFLLRLAEIRQLRKTNRLLVTSARPASVLT